MFKTCERESFISLKDHKENFLNNPKCRLLNPTKCELGKVSKQILSRIVSTIRKKTGYKQWKNVYSVIEWFKKLENKKNLSLILFDVVNYYPSITIELLEKALNWAKKYTVISDEELEIILETKKSILFMNGTFWTKKGENSFDVAMGSFDGAECTDLVGLFMLSELESQNLNAQLGLFRDDGLGASDAPKHEIDNIKQKICEVFRNQGLRITVDANKKIVQFLDVELNLNEESFKPFIKPNDVPLYVHKQSNHPPSITKNIPEAINKRLSALSSDEKTFASITPIYQEALKKSGYDYKLNFKPTDQNKKPNSRKRRKNILWFNPPFSTSVKTNVGAKFLQLIDKHFPKTNPLSKIISRQKTKLSYRTTPNMKRLISSHNAKLIKKSEAPPPGRTCNCRNKENCPLDGQCLLDNLVYQATLIPTPANNPTPNPTPPQTDSQALNYIGITSNTFKERLANHKKSFKHEKYSKETTLSRKVWKLREEGVECEIK